MQKLKKRIKENALDGVLLFFGEERYVLGIYLEKTVKTILNGADSLMNQDVFEGISEIEKVIDALETLPFLSDKRVLVLKDMGLFLKKNATKAEKLLEAIENIPSTTVMIIVENEVDKRAKLYKKLLKDSNTFEFEKQAEEDLVQHIANSLGKDNIKIDKATALHLIYSVGFELEHINNEIAKLSSYLKADSVVRIEDIDSLCSKSVENRIFELVECMGSSKRQRALALFQDLIVLKEPPARILYMLSRQFRVLLQVKLMQNKNFNRKDIASRLKLPPFVIDKSIRQGNKFTPEQLKKALRECLDIETKIKTGRINSEIGLEMIIIKYSQ